MKQVNLKDLKLSAPQYSVMAALANAQGSGRVPDWYRRRGVKQEGGRYAFHVGTSQYTDSPDFIAKAAPVSLRGLEKRGLIKIVDAYWRGALVVAMVDFIDDEQEEARRAAEQVETVARYREQVGAMVHRSRRQRFRVRVQTNTDALARSADAIEISITRTGSTWTTLSLCREEAVALEDALSTYLRRVKGTETDVEYGLKEGPSPDTWGTDREPRGAYE
jgi:hypothetical protein